MQIVELRTGHKYIHYVASMAFMNSHNDAAEEVLSCYTVQSRFLWNTWGKSLRSFLALENCTEFLSHLADLFLICCVSSQLLTTPNCSFKHLLINCSIPLYSGSFWFHILSDLITSFMFSFTTCAFVDVQPISFCSGKRRVCTKALIMVEIITYQFLEDYSA